MSLTNSTVESHKIRETWRAGAGAAILRRDKTQWKVGKIMTWVKSREISKHWADKFHTTVIKIRELEEHFKDKPKELALILKMVVLEDWDHIKLASGHIIKLMDEEEENQIFQHGAAVDYTKKQTGYRMVKNNAEWGKIANSFPGKTIWKQEFIMRYILNIPLAVCIDTNDTQNNSDTGARLWAAKTDWKRAEYCYLSSELGTPDFDADPVECQNLLLLIKE